MLKEKDPISGKASKADVKRAEKEAREAKKAAHREAQENEKAVRQAARESLKLDKEDVYAVKKFSFLKVLRFLVWAILLFIFAKGVMVSVRPDPAAEVNKTISDFRAELAAYQDNKNEVMAFAEGFAVEYFTYSSTTGAQDDYLARLGRYANSDVLNNIKKPPSGSAAKVLYAQAYRQETYSAVQVDVWVRLQVEYTSKAESGDGVISEQTAARETMVKVPVYIENGSYLVEDYPVFVGDSDKAAGYTPPVATRGTEVDNDTNEAVKVALTNFFTAYYGEKQSVINYYLDTGADPMDFIGLDGRIQFKAITELRVYYASETDMNHLVVLATVTAEDANGLNLLQSYNLTLSYRDKQYYISTMDARRAQ